MLEHPPLSRDIVSLAHVVDPTGCCKAIDLFIEAAVCGHAAACGMILNGPLGSGKRQIAIAAAAEFGTRIVEIEPMSIVSRCELLSLIDRTGPDGVLVVHNLDELPTRAQAELAMLVSTGLPLERSNAYSGDDPVDAIRPPRPRMTITTTNHLEAIPHPLRQASPCFTLRRSRDSIASALFWKLAIAGVSVDRRMLEGFVNMIYLAPPDCFDTVLAILIGQAGRCDGRHIDSTAGPSILELCWSTLTTPHLAEALRTSATEQGRHDADPTELAGELGVSPALHQDLRRHAIAESPDVATSLAERLSEGEVTDPGARRPPGHPES